MKTKTIITALLLGVTLLSGCAGSREINGKTYEPYGLFNEETVKDDNVTYQVSAGSVIVSIVFCESIVVPVYVVGWDLYEPVKMKNPPKPGKSA
jgi:hypothetical protein